MLKRNLIAIAIVTLGLGITSAFGQDREAGSGLATGIKKPTATIKKPKQVQPGNSGGTITNQRTSKKSLTKPCPNGYLIITLENCVKKTSGKSSSRTKKTVVSSTNQKLEAVRKPKSTKAMTEYVDNDEYRTKKPARKGSKGKRQHKP